MLNAKKLYEILKSLKASDSLVVAYSGGMDSHALLHVASNLKYVDKDIKVTAIHVNHNLNPNAKKWEEHCQKTCEELDIKLIIKSIQTKIAPKSGQSQEAIARDLRYKALSELLGSHDCLLTAHHLDDQAETLLLQLLRGAGPKGLSSMSARAQFPTFILLRPLLSFSEQELQNYASKNRLKWIEDESNTDINIGRNFIRHEVVPKIKQNWKGMLTTLSRTAENCREASALLYELAKEDYSKAEGSKPFTLSKQKLTALNEARQRNLIRYWLHLQAFPTPSKAKLEQIQKSVVESSYDATPLVSWRNTEVRRYCDDIYALKPKGEIAEKQSIEWPLASIPVKLPSNLGTLHFRSNLDQKSLDLLWKNISVEFRDGGERCKLRNRHMSHELKKLFQEWKIPPWQREFIPLVYRGEEIIYVVGYANCIDLDFEIEQVT